MPSNLRSSASDVASEQGTNGWLGEIRSDGYDTGSVTARVLAVAFQTDDQTAAQEQGPTIRLRRVFAVLMPI